ncbi:hypothetical protein ACFX2C_005448 [Malus domestica]
MEQQEQMHKQLIEMVEKKEKERLAREEAWKQQELERLKRDKEIRAQETSRNLALIPLSRIIWAMKFKSPNHHQQQHPNEHQHQQQYQYQYRDATNRRWPEAEVQALITQRAAFEHKFRVAGTPKGRIWEEISVKMHEMGYVRSGRKCREKWKNINKYFRRCMGSDNKRPANAKLCPYFHELELLQKSELVSFGNGFNRTINQNEANIEKQ